MTKNQKIFAGIDAVVRQKGLDRELIIEGLEESIALACKKTYGYEHLEVKINYDTKRITISGVKTVVAEVIDDMTEISLENALTHSKRAKLGDELKVRLKIEKDMLERAVVQSSKQVFRQKLKDAEYKRIIADYGEKVGKIVEGYVEEIKDNYIYFTLDKNTLAVLGPKGQIPNERLEPDVPVKLVIESIGPQSKKGPKVIVSRVSGVLLESLMAKNIPEIESGDIVVKSISRDAGKRSKVAVELASLDSDIDLIGACVGPRGSRINAIKQELNGENIDLIEYFDDARLFISNALAPSLVVAVQILSEEEKRSRVIVPDDHFSLAIGINGQNARLASMLTGWKIDIKSESMAREEEIDYEADMI